MPDGYGARMWGAMVAPRPLGIKETAKELFNIETGVTVLGVASGIAIGEYLGAWVKDYLKLGNDLTGLVAKAGVKVGLSFALFIIGGRLGRYPKVFLNGAAVGALASIVGDVVGQFVKPAFGMFSNPGIQGVNIKVNRAGGNTPVGSRSQVISSI